MTVRHTALAVLAAAAFTASLAAPAFAERNTGISASLQNAMEKTATAFCEGLRAWAEAVQNEGLNHPIPRTDRQVSDARSHAQQIRDTGRALGCAI